MVLQYVLLQEDKDLQKNGGAVHPETSEGVDHPPSAQVTEAPILPVVPSSPQNSSHPAELTGDNGQSVPVPDVPPQLPQNPPHAPLEDTRPRPHDNWYLHDHGHSREPHIHDLPLNDPHDLHPRQENSPGLHDDCRYPSDEPCGAHMYHKEVDREYLYYGDHSETYPPGYSYAPQHENTGYHDATGYRRPYYHEARYPDRELLDDRLRGPPPLDIHGEYMRPSSREGHAGYEHAYQRQPPRHRSSRSPIANVPLTLPGQVGEQEQHEGAAIPR
ncbi:uncharacterized protein EDB91DRAFT_1256431 [Suillus paluster]|uniref:uncharacterized protein n=1 Tax=Suillus paluster TaxID=48578 RepID=UPI001B86D194|nr:uncharacterized protein EDB91DRAFT_1256431 [Suillus paluster]KAG1721629.1 hypothetical protein EDB91DRAFT_1256431 [Suillus paluster]